MIEIITVNLIAKFVFCIYMHRILMSNYTCSSLKKFRDKSGYSNTRAAMEKHAHACQDTYTEEFSSAVRLVDMVCPRKQDTVQKVSK
jgi:hypothetical protein